MKDILSLLIPVVSVFVSYFLGQRQSLRTFSKDQAKHRYESFYVPFFTMLYAGRVWARAPHSLNFDSRSKLLDMFTQNLALLGPGLQACYPDLLDAHIRMLEYDSGKSDQEAAPDAYDRVFKRIESAAISEAKALSKELCLPPITHTYETCLRKSHAGKPTRTPAKRV